MLVPELTFKNNNQPVGSMLPPPAFALRGEGSGAKTPPLQRQGKAKPQQSTVRHNNKQSTGSEKKRQHWQKRQHSTGRD